MTHFKLPTIACAALVAIAVPAGAAGTPVKADVVRDDINRLDGDIDRADSNSVQCPRL